MPPPDTEAARWFKDEVHLHDARLTAYLRRAFPTVRDVDDLVQESYLRIWRSRLAQPVHSAKSFLFQIARNLARDHLRHRSVSPEVECPDLSELAVFEDGPGVADIACTEEELDLLAQAIEALPGRCREVIILRQIKGLSQKEIAAQLGLSVLSVQTYVVRGLRRMEATMQKYRVSR